jgi:RNA-directed DNA polymerase
MSPKRSKTKSQAQIWTEGKTDWKILKRALKILRPNLKIEFHESEKEMGDDKLLKKLETFAEKENLIPTIFIFDRDNPETVSKVNDIDKGFKEWGNNIFSICLPPPLHRLDHECVCIELYFTDEELRTKDSKGRRIFFSSEFNETSGKYKDDPTIHYGKVGYLKGHTGINKSRIVDTDVYDSDSKNIALSKSDFAEYILKGEQPFDVFQFDAFENIFALLDNILEQSSEKHNPYYPDLVNFLSEISSLDKISQFLSTFNLFNDITALGLQIFIISTIRFYESQIINEHIAYKKKVMPIRTIITESFRQPSLSVLSDLATKCYYLVDGKAPSKLQEMKKALNSTITLDNIGKMLDDFDILFPKEHGAQKKRTILRKDFIMEVLPELTETFIYNQDVVNDGLQNVDDYPEINIDSWIKSIEQLTEIFTPIFANPVYFRTIKSLDPATNEYIVDLKIFSNNKIIQSEERISMASEESEFKTSELQLADDLFIRLYPFLLIKDDSLFFYKRTLPTRYEYYSVVSKQTHVEPTKAKFSSSVFKFGSKQELFWTDVIPRVNEKNGIKANIPKEGPGEFIGRRKKINQIKDEIISIINENAIIYGPGGIGKTALMIQLSNELYEEKKKENVEFKNIIWVSAKNDYYDSVLDSIEIRSPQIETLGNILYATLRFFEIENLEEYSVDDLKELTVILLQENKILLVIDNFETIKKEEQDKILAFFGTQIKLLLKKTSENFKVILTSREMVASGFKQIELTGLDLAEAKRFMASLHKRYKSAADLTNEQKELLHQATKGIPILLKHCFARIYEYNESFNTVINNLPTFSSKLVQFSFQEILDRIRKEKDQTSLQILILLEIVNRPLMIRQMSDILEINELRIEKSLPLLANFECIRRKVVDDWEKYTLNDEISLLTKSLSREHRELYQEIRKKYFRNFSIDKQMDYSSDEENLIQIFESYVRETQFSEASEFIKDQLRKKPESIILNYYYAKYLKENRIDTTEAIRILEKLTEISGNHPSVLRLLFSCYSTMEIPNFDKSNNLISQIISDLGDEIEVDMQVEIARFYVRWSIYLRHKKGIDPYEENKRIHEYKEKAQKAISILQPIESKIGDPTWNKVTSKINQVEVYYLLSQCYFNLWESTIALKMINKAISSAGFKHPSLRTYENLRSKIQETQEFYSRNSWAGRSR